MEHNQLLLKMKKKKKRKWKENCKKKTASNKCINRQVNKQTNKHEFGLNEEKVLKESKKKKKMTIL